MKMENMENNILTQIYNDPKNLEPKELFEYVQDLYTEYINSINNEIGENSYKNAEDSRMLDEEKILKANEFGMSISNNELFRTGSCIRKVYFQLNGAIGENRKIDDVEIEERNKLIIEQWLRKLEFLKILAKPEHKVASENGLRIQSTENGFIYDARKGMTYALLIKPVNDTAFSIRDRLFPSFPNMKPDILNSHVPEIIVNMLILKQPVKILYVGKNNPSLVREFDCGISNRLLTVNGEIKENINVLSVCEDIKQLNYALEEKVIPPRKYKEYTGISQEETADLLNLNFINKREMTEILNGKPYLNFYCSSCRYKNICNSISEDWFKE